MPSIVSTIRSIGVEGRTVPEALTAAGPEGISIEFSNGARVRLAPQSRGFAEIIEELRTLGAPVCVETDRQGVVRAVWIPAVFRVESLEMTREGDVSVQLIISHARHVLRADQPHFNSFRDILSAAKASATPVMVTENGAGEIIDVREAPSDHPFALAHPDQIQPAGAAKMADTPIPRISLAEAQRLFGLCAGTSCNPTTIPPHCIPFLYPRDGCWARAHEMYRLMNAQGAPPWKLWNFGNLAVRTRNDPECQLSWVYHVAPYLYVDIGGGTYHAYVFDPSLFSEPVWAESWRAAQGADPDAVVFGTDGTIYWRNRKGETLEDPTYGLTNQALNLYRLQLKAEALGPSGPPPYAQCPVEVA